MRCVHFVIHGLGNISIRVVPVFEKSHDRVGGFFTLCYGIKHDDVVGYDDHADISVALIIVVFSF
jgi:hypothetical protein